MLPHDAVNNKTPAKRAHDIVLLIFLLLVFIISQFLRNHNLCKDSKKYESERFQYIFYYFSLALLSMYGNNI